MRVDMKIVEQAIKGEAVSFKTKELVRRGDKVAQLLIQPIVSATIEEVSELTKTTRGDGAYGSYNPPFPFRPLSRTDRGQGPAEAKNG